MKPIRISMTAFGPYKDLEVIDFTELKNHRLFVVSGNTGAGKTTIFDAICFAFYGSASGEDRSDSKMMRSHFANDDVYTSVDFLFQVKGRQYRIFRQLAHVRKGNKTATGDRNELYEIVNGQEVPLTDRFIVSHVNQRIQQLIGLTKDQFSQIVMLPQGEFQKLLVSETENKEEILRRLFKTGLYKIVAESLNEKRKQVQEISKELASLREFHISGLKASFAGRDGSELSSVFKQEHYNTYQVLEALDKEIDYWEERNRSLTGLLASQLAEFQATTAIYHQAQSLNQQFDLLNQKASAKQRLEEQETEYKHKTRQLFLAEQAVHLKLYEQHDLELTGEFSRKAKLSEEADLEWRQAETALQDAKIRYSEEENRQAQREQNVRQLERLQSFLPVVTEMSRTRQRVLRLEQEAEALALQLREIETELAAKQTERAKASEQAKQLEDSWVQLSGCSERLSLLQQQAVLLQEYRKLLQKAETEQQEELRLRQTCERADREYAALEASWVEGQAGVLASLLLDGEPCPVCGGVEHPKKAVPAGAIPSREELDRKRSEKTKSEKMYFAAKAALDTTRQQIETKRQQVLEQGFHPDHLLKELQDLLNAVQDATEEVRQLRERGQQFMRLKQALEALDSSLDQVRKRKEQWSARLNEKKTICAAQSALYRQALSSVPEELQTLEKLEQHTSMLAARKKQLETAWKQAQAIYQAANERYVKAAAGREHAQNQRQDAQSAKDRARQTFLDALQKAGFQTEAAYRAAKMTEAEQGVLKKQIEEYYAALKTLQQQIEELSAVLKGKERQDLAALNQHLQEQSQAIDKLRSQNLTAEQKVEKGIELKLHILQAEEKWKEAEQQYQMVKDLYDVVRGENDKKISFERYLQIEFLEKIISVANKRLQRMLSGQYYLVRSDRLEKHGKQSGLALDIFDHYTGQLRDVKTMSGGEKFTVSLCLALGMADVIQSYEGGIQLETMFIDEGFGSLDEESLNKAIDTLMDLQQSGRMIGVISHVQELKQAIPAILEVKKTREGSSYTRFVVH